MTNREAAIKVIKELNRNGFEALLAGGCVRDMLLCRQASDYDVATNAKPADVIKLFKRTLKVGAKFGVIIILMQSQQIEVATFRSEAGYTDGRHPTGVKFTTALEDASRRDFTINGLFYDPLKKQVLDYVKGQADLEKQLIKTIGKPYQRFTEDYLRMLRAIRFSTRLNFKIEPKTWSAICSNADNITRISAERITMELEGILTNPSRAAGASMLIKSGLAEAIFGDFADKDTKLILKILAQLRKRTDFALALAAFFVTHSTESALAKFKRLKLSRRQTKHVKFLLANRGKLLDDDMSLAKLKLLLCEPYFWDLYELQRAIQKAEIDSRKAIEPLTKLRKRIKALGDVELKPDPLLNGHDLIRLGAVQGPMLGQLAEEMYIAQLEGQLQTAHQAKQWVRDWLQKHRNIQKKL